MKAKQERLSWLKQELVARHSKTILRTRALAHWFLSYGYSLGIPEEELRQELGGYPRLHRAATRLTREDIRAGKPEPDFAYGQSVEVVLGDRNKTQRSGTVAEITWHHKRGQWYYRIANGQKLVHKQYWSDDLRHSESTGD